MYGIGPTMYLAMLSFQLPLPQTIATFPKTNHEAPTMDKADLT
jgi:hypothetical protein